MELVAESNFFLASRGMNPNYTKLRSFKIGTTLFSSYRKGLLITMVPTWVTTSTMLSLISLFIYLYIRPGPGSRDRDLRNFYLFCCGNSPEKGLPTYCRFESSTPRIGS
jgi:hypothetical protein